MKSLYIGFFRGMPIKKVHVLQSGLSTRFLRFSIKNRFRLLLAIACTYFMTHNLNFSSEKHRRAKPVSRYGSLAEPAENPPKAVIDSKGLLRKSISKEEDVPKKSGEIENIWKHDLNQILLHKSSQKNSTYYTLPETSVSGQSKVFFLWYACS